MRAGGRGGEEKAQGLRESPCCICVPHTWSSWVVMEEVMLGSLKWPGHHNLHEHSFRVVNGYLCLDRLMLQEAA